MKLSKKLLTLCLSSALALSFSTSAFADNFEPNDVRSNATIIGPGGYLSYISSTADLDYFLLEGYQNGTVTINLVPPSGKDYFLAVFNSSGVMTAWSNKSSDQTEVINLNVTKGNQYFIRISSQDGTSYDPNRPYLLSLSDFY